MNIEWIQARRRPDWPWWSIAVLALWLALGGVNLLLAASAGRQISLCLFKRVTGVPCPTCGFTRGSMQFLAGHPIQGWLYNPLLFTFLGGWVALLAIRVFLGRRPVAHPNRVERRAAWIAFAVLFTANWLYVLRYVG
jgi:hypothetical protein